MDRDTFSKVGIFLGGFAIGSLIGILFAPSSGQETRDRIKDSYRALEEKTKEKLGEIKDAAKHHLEKIKEITSDAIAKGKEAFHKEKKA